MVSVHAPLHSSPPSPPPSLPSPSARDISVYTPLDVRISISYWFFYRICHIHMDRTISRCRRVPNRCDDVYDRKGGSTRGEREMSMLCDAMRCCAMPCCAMLCYAMLCYAMLACGCIHGRPSSASHLLLLSVSHLFCQLLRLFLMLCTPIRLTLQLCLHLQ